VAEVYDFKKKRYTLKTEFEYCTICGQKTNIRRDENINNRIGYVEGVGQLCYDCYKRLHK